MSRFLSNSNLFSLLSRRGYASASVAAAASKSAGEERMVATMRGKKESSETVWTSSWVPDPVTGYYRPANRVGEMDPAELRQMLLSRKSP
ncbi:uncharacterized protein A4U43_C07F14020 [Asparagus officinalis]|uniref:Late embryogenesis abundant protein Lea5 n=1 Tax=Asparagus officinalis TaxID=4686 RepID=A0A5P1EBU5_ASPOF|nr:uncharacterized protein A4U43_C07F14020 [Asparagus officinalis]